MNKKICQKLPENPNIYDREKNFDKTHSIKFQLLLLK